MVGEKSLQIKIPHCTIGENSNFFLLFSRHYLLMFWSFTFSDTLYFLSIIIEPLQQKTFAIKGRNFC